METDYQKILDDLTVLLQDICQFLSSDKLGALSHRDRKLMESLINRSKVQLQEIAKVEKLTQEYVDMDAKKVLVHQEEEEKLEIYSSVDDVNKNEDILMQQEILSPYIDLPAKEASQHVKCGIMSMRRKFLLGFEMMKRVYATIHNHWLLIYITDKDTKPICTFNLKYYEARKVEGPKSSNFELISTLSDGKTFHFTAITPKDMLQWVANIYRCHNNAIIQSKGFDIQEDIEPENEEHYHDISMCVDQRNEEEEGIYYEPSDIRKSTPNNNTIPHKEPVTDSTFSPPLPGRPQKGLISVVPHTVKLPSPLHSSQNSLASLASYDDINDLQKTSKPSMADTCLDDDDDEDNIYEEFVHVKQNIIKQSNPIPVETSNTVGESDQLETDTVTRKDDAEDPKAQNETAVCIKNRIDRYQASDPPATPEKCAISDRSRNRSFIHKGVPNRISIPNTCDEMKNAVFKTENKSSNLTVSNSQSVCGLSPPVLPKVPVVPLKPKVRDGPPSINRRSPFATIRQTVTDR